jgi:chromosome segregation ATPase
MRKIKGNHIEFYPLSGNCDTDETDLDEVSGEVENLGKDLSALKILRDELKDDLECVTDLLEEVDSQWDEMKEREKVLENPVHLSFEAETEDEAIEKAVAAFREARR